MFDPLLGGTNIYLFRLDLLDKNQEKKWGGARQKYLGMRVKKNFRRQKK